MQVKKLTARGNRKGKRRHGDNMRAIWGQLESDVGRNEHPKGGAGGERAETGGQRWTTGRR
jgi:hypothetical protein